VLFPPLGVSLILLLLLVAAIYCGYRAVAPRPFRWSRYRAGLLGAPVHGRLRSAGVNHPLAAFSGIAA
jgi:hypothetical protein